MYALRANLERSAKSYMDLAQLQYINGVINYLDVLDAQRGYFDAQIGLSNAIRDELITVVQLYKALGMQIVFSDTPGVLKPNYKLQESMLNFSTSALTDADVLLYVTDVVETPDKHNDFVEKVGHLDVPVLLLINKIDLSNQEKLVELVEAWKELLPKAEIIPISATSKFNVDYVMKRKKRCYCL